ncbi:DUF899 domain-containing protein [Sphingomonas crocodyli]|uniref:DUF899 domain-containing protein n=1 Tax=Sphingomonas crocodyli TaxID=1979270 RepID=A0A437LYX3_9SPHN|nr:DUF899 domain-containing protein [Sphingomonas crocodyli]
MNGESEAYVKARKALLLLEIEERRTMTRVAEQQRRLPPGPRARNTSDPVGCVGNPFAVDLYHSIE